MNKGMKYFTEGMLAAFVLAPRVPVQAVEPVVIKEHLPVGNAARHWQVVGQHMKVGTKVIISELQNSERELLCK